MNSFTGIFDSILSSPHAPHVLSPPAPLMFTTPVGNPDIQVHLQFFCKSKLQSRQKGCAAMQISFNSIIVFTKQPSAERYLENIIFSSVFVNFQKVLAVHQKKHSLEILESSQKNTCGKSYFSKVAGFYRSSQCRCSVKKGFFRNVFAKFTGKHLFQRLF